MHRLVKRSLSTIAGSRMIGASVTNLGFSGAVFDVILVDRGIRRTEHASFDHITRFYMREHSFFTILFYLRSTYI